MLEIPELDLSELMKEYDNYDRTGKEFCARCGAELEPSESYLCDFCRYDEMTS